MADQTNESILFEIKINSEQYKSEQKLIRDSLQQLALDIEKTKSAQKLLNDERKAGKVTDADYAQQSVKLREQLRGQMADQRELEKGLATSQKAYNASAGSAEQLRAQLAELATAYYAMGEAERKSAEGQAVQKQALAVSDALKAIEFSVGSTGRNVGNYAASFKQGLAPIVGELAKVQAAIKGVDENSEQGALLQQKRIGFLTAAQRAAAQAGITDFSQAQATIDQYAQALQPAAENLVRIQQEQQQVGQTVGESSQQYQELGFKLAGAQKALDDVVAAQVAAEKASVAGGAAAQGQAGAVEVAANSLAGLRAQLIQLEQTRESLDPTTKEAQELNTTILELRTNIQQAEGKIDEFGERVQKNIKKENFDTVSDAIQGMVGAMSVATLVFGDNTDAAAAQAKALQLMAIAQNARAIAIGIDSAKDAASIVLKKALGLFLKEEATLTAAAAVSTEAHAAVASADATAVEAQAGAAALNAEAQTESAAGTAASTVATEAQTAVTAQATIGQRLLNIAMRANPIGLIIIAVAALVAGFLAYRNASDKTQQKVKDITEAFLRFSNPIGLIYTGIEKLYQKFAGVRAVLDPFLSAFEKLAGQTVDVARRIGESIGLLDTAAEKAIKATQQQLEGIEALKTSYAEQSKAYQLAGLGMEQVRAKERQGLVKELELRTTLNKQLDAQETLKNKRLLDSIDRKLAANLILNDQEKKLFDERQERNNAEIAAQNALNEFDYATIETRRAARQQEAQDVQNDASRAVQRLSQRIAQQDAAENAQLQRNLTRLNTRLSAVQQGTLAELNLQKQKLDAETTLQAKQATDELAVKTRARALGYADEKAALAKQQREALQQFGLTEQQRMALLSEQMQERFDLEQKYSLKAARQAVADIPVQQAATAAAKLKLEADFYRQVGVLVLESQAEQNRARIAGAKAGSVERRNLESTLINQEQELAIAALDQRAMSTLEYETKVTAIRADAVAKRKALSEQDTQNVIAELGEQQRGAELNQQKQLAGLGEFHQLGVRASQAYANERVRAEIDSYAAQLAATKEGTVARENVEKQHALNLKAIEDDTDNAQIQLAAAKYEKIADIARQSISALSTLQDAATQNQLDRIQKEMNATGTSAARKAVLAKQQERIETEQHKRQQKYAVAQALIDGGSAVMRILADTPKFDFGIATALQIALAAVTTAAQVRAISSQQFAVGGVVQGPSHQQGGVQLWHRNGAHLGEMEGDEIILTKGVYHDKRLRAAASALNVAAGGRSFYQDPTPASTWARYAEGGVVSSSAMYLPQVRTGGVVQQAPAPAIDYDLLTTKLTAAFVNGARSLPAPETNLVELRQRVKDLDQRDAQTDI
jgi:hypothetical protein